LLKIAEEKRARTDGRGAARKSGILHFCEITGR
jgi:hypothetical protein